MNEQEKQAYLEQYKQDKEDGVPFFPDILFKDAVISLAVFLILVGLAYFIGAPLEEPANPADTTYNPRPEWYFLFLFQLLKYFPGSLEVVGVVVIPTVAILLLFLLPFLDTKKQRHFRGRPLVTSITLLGIIGIGFLSIQSYRETPPPEEATQGDETAALYARNCAGCHGPSISVEPGSNLNAIITQGGHEGMPAWSGDLTNEQIDALAGFILSPSGSALFTETCGGCHKVADLVSGNPIQLKDAIDTGSSYPPHEGSDIPEWTNVLDQRGQTALLNFMVAPDGQRLYVTNCSSCHGRSVSFSGNENTLRDLISQGGLHLEMPPWQERLSAAELDTLAAYTVDPESVPDGQELFQQYCSSCHGQRIPSQENLEQAKQTISTGGPHETMPVWGNILTNEQMNALVSYTMNASLGTSVDLGRNLFADNCANCHGDFGEGGANPSRPGDIIAPISSGEYLSTRDDSTLRAIISQGQPNFGMSPFGNSNGGPLSDDEINAIVDYIRTWESNPPVELPPEINAQQLSASGPEVYQDLCAQCHGFEGEGGVGPALNDPQFQETNTDQEIFDTVNNGHDATSMIAWGEILTTEQIQQLVSYIRELKQAEAGLGPTSTARPVSFSSDLSPIFEAKCVFCHGDLGGWDSSSYEAVMTTGNNAPVVLPGNPENSLLVQKLEGTQAEGEIMPPAGKLPDTDIQKIISWISAGAPDN
jgi:mono/diheme cytochrome c family protein